jgi:phosphate transport system substrate-binding protein
MVMTMHYTLRSPSIRLCLLFWLLIVILAAAAPSRAQSAEDLLHVKKLYVDSFGHNKSALEMRIHILRRLGRTSKLQAVSNLKDADALMKCNGQIWTIGHVSMSFHTDKAKLPILQGFLSCEVIGKGNQTLWSYLVTPSRFPWSGIADDLAGQLVSRLLGDVESKVRVTATSITGAPAPKVPVSLKGAGATFPAPLYQKWFELFEKDHPGVHIDYDAVGSGSGIQRLHDGTVDFGASEMPLSDQEMAEGRHRFIQIPMVLGGLVAIYNIKHLNRNLNFTPEILAGIYLGHIKKWNDPRIKAANREAALPDAEIVVIHRSDTSGSTYAWSDYLSKVSPEWKTSVGAGIDLHWPVGVGAEHNEGVAAAVQETTNSIGYVEFIYALQHELGFAIVRNSAGQFVKADIASVTEAARSAGSPDRGFRISITNAPGKGAYPIATYSWLLLPQPIQDKKRGDVLVNLVRWMLTSGQKSCSALGYASLPPDVAKRDLQTLDQSISEASLSP